MLVIGIYLCVLVVFATVDETVGGTPSVSQKEYDSKIYAAENDKNPYENIKKIAERIPDILKYLNNVNLTIIKVKEEAYTLSIPARISVNKALSILENAERLVPSSCADANPSKSFKISRKSDEQFVNAILKAMDKFKPVEKSLESIKKGLYPSDVEAGIKDCKRFRYDIRASDLEDIVSCITNTKQSFYVYLDYQGYYIGREDDKIKALSPKVLKDLVSDFNKISSENIFEIKTEAENILDCGGFSARKLVENLKDTLAKLNVEMDASLSNSFNAGLNFISTYKDALNRKIVNTKAVLESLLQKVNDYASYISFIAPDRISQIHKQLELVEGNGTVQLNNIDKLYSETFRMFNLLNVTLSEIYNEYKNVYKSLISMNFSALISPNITERLESNLQAGLNIYIDQLVNAVGKAQGALYNTKNEFFSKIDKSISDAEEDRRSVELSFAKYITRSIDIIYLLAGVELRYSASIVVEQLNNSLNSQQSIIADAYHRVKRLLDGFKLTYNDSLRRVLNPIKILIDNETNPYYNTISINNAFNKIHNDTSGKLLVIINLALQNALNIYSKDFVNITAELKLVEGAVNNCFNNFDQHLAVLCGNKAIAHFNVSLSKLRIEGFQRSVDLENLPFSLEINIVKFIEDAKKQTNDLYLVVKENAAFINVTAEVKKMLTDKENNIDPKLKTVQDLINLIVNTNVQTDLYSKIDSYITPYTKLISAVNISFPNVQVSLEVSTIPAFKNQSINIIKSTIDNVIRNRSQHLQNRLNGIKENLNREFGTIDDNVIYNICHEYFLTLSYSDCISKHVNSYKSNIGDTNNILSDLIVAVEEANSSIKNTLQNALNNVYTTSAGKAADVLGNLGNTIVVWPKKFINAIVESIELSNQMNHTLLNDSIQKILTPIYEALGNVELYSGFENVLDILKRLEYNLILEFKNYTYNALKEVNRINHASNNITFDVNNSLLKVKNCLDSYSDIEQVVNLCVIPTVNEVDIDLKIKSSTLIKLRNDISELSVKVRADILLLLNKFSTNANEIVRTAKQNANSTYYLAVIRGKISEKLSNIRRSGNYIRLAIDTVRNYIYAPSNIYKSVDPLVISMEVILRLFHDVDLTDQQYYLQQLISNARTKISAIAVATKFKYLFNASRINEIYRKIFPNIYKKSEEINHQNLTIACNRDSTTQEQFRICVQNYYDDFKIYVDNSGIVKLGDDAKNILLSINSEMNNKLSIIYNENFNLSNTASIDLFNKNNITRENIIQYVLKDYGWRFNITPILLTINQIKTDALELQNRYTFALDLSNNNLFNSGSVVYDIADIRGNLSSSLKGCSVNSFDELLKETVDKVAALTKYVFTKAPQLLPTIYELLKSSNVLNSTLFYQVSLLETENLRLLCADKKLYEIYSCLVQQVDKFSDYYNVEIKKLSNYTSRSYDKLRDASEELDLWRKEYVLPEAANVTAEMKSKAERFYETCGVNDSYLIDYAVKVGRSYYNIYQPKIMNAYTEINRLANIVKNTNYSGSISARLESSAQPLYKAINTVPASDVTRNTRLDLQNLIENSTKQFKAYVDNIPIQASLYINQSESLLKTRDVILNNYEEYLQQTCYDSSSNLRLTNLVCCGNARRYTQIEVIANNNTLNSLLEMERFLTEFHSRGTELINSYVDSLDKDFSNSIYLVAYRVYNLAGLTVPQSVAYQVKGKRCVTAVNTNPFYCVVTT